jgi:DnaJ-class molecular chaperone
MICSRCNGKMRISDYENSDRYSEDGKMPCPSCEGEGEIEKQENNND